MSTTDTQHPAAPTTRPGGRHAAPRIWRRQPVEYADMVQRDWDLDVLVGVDVSHRRCAGGPECFRVLPVTPMSLPGGTLALAAVAALALLTVRS